MRVAAAWAMALLFLAALAHADILVLSNGDRLTGVVVKRENGKITFHSEVLGDIVVAENGATIVPNPPATTANSANSLVGLPPPQAVKAEPWPSRSSRPW